MAPDAVEQSRARHPTSEGYVERGGVRVFYEVYGDQGPVVLFVPPWSIVHSRCWKMQIPYLSRHCRVIVFDPRGNGRSDRPQASAAYDEREFAGDALAVMDATGTEAAYVVTLSLGAHRTLILTAEHPERVRGIAFIAPTLPLSAPTREDGFAFDEPLDTDDGWAKFNAPYWRRDFPGFVDFFMRQCATSPHSTKLIEDAIGWGLETDAETLIAAARGSVLDESTTRELCSRVHCPVLVIHGTDDAITPLTRGEALAEATGGALVAIAGGSHLINARNPVEVNLLLHDFIRQGAAPAPWKPRLPRGRSRHRRVLFISSPIGLGHTQRDLAVARELRTAHPDLQIDWLAQPPVSGVLQQQGERIHPASPHLASESAHIESESAEHDLHCFQAIRRMDEILLANFMVFHDVVREAAYDLWIGDEAWELDYYLHENPQQKQAPYVWLTDFVGWLPMPDGGQREAVLTADYNAEMLDHIETLPGVRDRALYVGNADDIVPDSFGPDLPAIRDWTMEHYELTGYVTGFDPAPLADRTALRAALGFRPDEQVCIVTVGGSGVGGHLLRRVVGAFPSAKQLVPSLRMIVVTGPRIEPFSVEQRAGLEIRAYVPDLYRHLAACDVAVVQGGLTTTMELTANRRPFLYFPLRHHFEQNLHVRHRLQRYGAGRCMDYATATTETIAHAICDELTRPVDYRPVETDGAARAAALIADLL